MNHMSIMHSHLLVQRSDRRLEATVRPTASKRCRRSGGCPPHLRLRTVYAAAAALVSACVADRNVPRYLIASPFILGNKALAMYNPPKYTARELLRARRGMPRISVLNAHLYPAPEADQTPLEIGVWVWQMTGERWSGRTDHSSDYAYARKKWVRFWTYRVTERIGDRYEFHPSAYTRNSSRLATLRAQLDRAKESGDVDAMTKLTAALERCRGDVLQDVEDFACVFDEDKKRCVDKYRERQNNFNTTHVCGSCGVRNPYDPGKVIWWYDPGRPRLPCGLRRCTVHQQSTARTIMQGREH